MARYEGRHRTAPAPAPSSAPTRTSGASATRRTTQQPTSVLAATAPVTRVNAQERPSAPPTSRNAQQLTSALTASASATRRSARRHEAPSTKRRVGRPVLAGALALGLGASAFTYATATDLGASDAAFVVGDGVAAQTAELARAATVDTTYRAAASVSRNERRTAIAATGLRNAAELEKKRKAEAARKAAEAKEAAEAAAREKDRKAAIARAKESPAAAMAAARVIMPEYGWTSDAQYNCLVNLWNGESDWRYWAENSSSGAYGIPQSLPASKMATMGSDYRTNPITQIKWGLWYIQQSYGNPCNAWSTWLSRSPHWY